MVMPKEGAPNWMIFPVLKTCKHLRLLPTERNRATVKAIMHELEHGGDRETPEETNELCQQLLGVDRIGGNQFQAECLKMRACCVITPSAVISERTPLVFLTANNYRMAECDEREVLECFDILAHIQWVIKHLDVSDQPNPTL